METRTIEVQTNDGPMAMFEAVPDGDARGAVVVIQEAFGVNDHIEDVTQRLAGEGYHAVAPHIFRRTGDPVIPYGKFEDVLPNFKALSDEAVLVDVDAALEHLAGAGFRHEQIGIVGFCFGGRVTFLVAARRTLGAAVGVYGGGVAAAGPMPVPPLTHAAS